MLSEYVFVCVYVLFFFFAIEVDDDDAAGHRHSPIINFYK